MTYEEIAQGYEKLAEEAERKAAETSETATSYDGPAYHMEKALAWRSEANRQRRIALAAAQEDAAREAMGPELLRVQSETSARLRDIESVIPHRDAIIGHLVQTREIYLQLVEAIRSLRT